MPYVFFPPPPDTARFQYLGTIRSQDDLKEGGRSVFATIVGEEEKQSPIRIIRPYGVASDSGVIYVCDVNLPGIQKIDLRERLIQQTTSPTMLQPSNCALDPVTDDLYIVENQRDEIVVLGANGLFNGVVDDSLRVPAGVFVSDDRIWVTDLTTKQVRVYDKATRRHLRAFPDADLPPNDPADLKWPMNIYVWKDRVFVTDQFAGQVQVYTTDGEYVRSIGSRGLGFGQFDIAKGLAVDSAGRVYVADFRWSHVQVFDQEGTLLTFIGAGTYRGPGYLGGPIDVWIDYDNLEFFQERVHPDFTLKHLVLVMNQLSPDKLVIYGFVERKQGP